MIESERFICSLKFVTVYLSIIFLSIIAVIYKFQVTLFCYNIWYIYYIGYVYEENIWSTMN